MAKIDILKKTLRSYLPPGIDLNDFIKTEYFPCSDWEIHPYITDLDLFFNNLEYTKIKYLIKKTLLTSHFLTTKK